MGQSMSERPLRDQNSSRTGLSVQQESALARVQSVGELVALLREHQRRRWQQHDPVQVESYLANFPLLASDGQAVADLIMNEMLLREENGTPLELAEYLQRLPAYAGAIELRFGMHLLLMGGPANQDTDHGRPATRCDNRPPMKLTAGTRLGPYEILGPLGAGGMGQVFSARDVKLDRRVAIKVLRDVSADDPAWLARFDREARTAGGADPSQYRHRSRPG